MAILDDVDRSYGACVLINFVEVIHDLLLERFGDGAAAELQ